MYNNGDNDNDADNNTPNPSPVYNGHLDDPMEYGVRGQVAHCRSILDLSPEVPGLERHAPDLGLFPFNMMTPLHQDDAEAGFIDIDIDQDWDHFGFGCSRAKRRPGDSPTTSASFFGKSPTWTSMSSRSTGASSLIQSNHHRRFSSSLDSGSGSGSGPSSALRVAVEPSGSECEDHWYDVFARCKKLQFLVHGIAGRSLHDSFVPLQPQQKSVQPLMERFTRLERVNQHERECRALTRTSGWLPTAPSTPCAVRDLLPSRPICDVLLDAYINTFESVLRILHVPSFLRDHERFWTGSTSRSEDPDEPFQCKLLVAIAIGSCTCANLDVSLRRQAGSWISHGKQWLTRKMDQGSRPDLDMAQIACLLALARHTHHHHNDASSSDTSRLPGGHDLTRMAIQMGLHREPRIRSPGMSAREAEIRRRLWATMLELSLQLCFDQGLPAPLAPESYDCEAPSNIPDEDIALGLELSDCPVKFTSSTLLVLLARTQRLRLQILHLLNVTGASRTYDDSHQLAAEMNDACCADLDTLRLMSTPKPTNFQIKLLDMFTRPFVLALHGPFADQATGKPAYYYSRRARLEVSTLLLAYPPLPASTSAEADPGATATTNNQPKATTPSTSEPTTTEPDQDAYAALRIHGHGHFALVQRQATAALCVDLMGELEENAFPTLDGGASRQQLRDVLRGAVGTFERRVRASGGAHSAREFVFFSCAEAFIGAMVQQQGRHGDGSRSSRDADWAIAGAARTALAICCEVMELPRREGCACACAGDGGRGTAMETARRGKGHGEEDMSMWLRDDDGLNGDFQLDFYSLGPPRS